MRIAILTDIHANREALEAVLDHAAGFRPDRLAILGDIVGYGADPGWCTDRVMALAEQGAIVLSGNHDEAVGISEPDMNDVALKAIRWTRDQLTQDQRDWLKTLPLIHEDGRLLFVHADASKPSRWRYVTGIDAAAESLAATRADVTFCGHVHRPALYHTSVGGKASRFQPVQGIATPLAASRRWLAVIGSVGQPRDANPAAAWALHDTERREITFQRTPYDVDTAMAKIRAADLPDELARRLERGL